VTTSPLTIAVALMTDGMGVPKTWGFSGSRRAWVLLGAFAGGALCARCWARAELAAAAAIDAVTIHARVEFNPKTPATIRFFP
jgi:hypothetical protein